MKIERHYENVLPYIAKIRCVYVNLYAVYMYEKDNIDIWFFLSLEDAKLYASHIKALVFCEDTYIKELQCYVDGAGVVSIQYTHVIDD